MSLARVSLARVSLARVTQPPAQAYASMGFMARLTVVAAHFGWPWQLDLIAMALHKTNVYIDISGWSPRRILAEVIRELRGSAVRAVRVGQRLPVLHAGTVPVRAGRPQAAADVVRAVLHDNAARVLS